MENQIISINLVPNLSTPAVVRVSQYDVGRPLVFKVYDGTSPADLTGVTAVIEGTKKSGLGFSESGTVSDNTVTLDTTLAMTQEDGSIPAEIRFTKTGEDVGTANFILAVEKTPHADGTTDGTQETMANLETRLQGQIDSLEEDVERLNDGGLIIKDEIIEQDVANWLNEHPEATTTVQDGSLTEQKFSDALKTKTIKDVVTPQMYGAKGDGVTNDTASWTTFVAKKNSAKFIPKGSYLVNGKVKKFNKDVLGGDNFDLVNRWTKTPLASKDAPVQMYDELDIVDDLPDGWTQSFASWILQKHMTGDRDLPPSNMYPVGQHIDLILDGNLTHAYEPGSAGGNNSPNYTGMVVTANNRMSGNIGVTGVTARLKDLSETDNPNQLTNGVTKMGAFYAEVRRNTRYNTVNKDIGVGGSYGFGMETYVYWDSDESEIYEAKENFGDYKSWMCGYHCTSASNNLPITAGILIDRTSGANSGFYNGIIIGGMSMKVGSVAQGATGTVGLNFESWKSSAYGETAIKYGYAHRHHWYKNIAKISAPSVRMANENGVFVLGLGSKGANPSGIQFFGGADYDNIQETDSGVTTYGSIRVDAQAFFSSATTKFRWSVQSGNTTGHLDLSATALAPIEQQSLGTSSYHWGNAYINTLILGSTTLTEANLQRLLALLS